MHTEEVRQALQALQEVKESQSSGMPLSAATEESEVLEAAQAYGLCRLKEGPLLTRAGQQFLDCQGRVEHAMLHFLPVIDDLAGRAAVAAAGRTLLKSFADALSAGQGVQFAGALVPEAFEPQLNEQDAYRLYAACAGLCSSLACGELPSCLAEELALVALIGIASDHLQESPALSESQALKATQALGSLLEALGDSHALMLHEMQEPADAAVLNADPSFGFDLRFEAWFEPMWGRAPIGYLGS